MISDCIQIIIFIFGKIARREICYTQPAQNYRDGITVCHYQYPLMFVLVTLKRSNQPIAGIVRYVLYGVDMLPDPERVGRLLCSPELAYIDPVDLILQGPVKISTPLLSLNTQFMIIARGFFFTVPHYIYYPFF